MELTEQEKEKKKILDNIFYEIGKQKYDYELASLYKDREGITKSRGKWKFFKEICFDVEKHLTIFKRLNCRTILPIEIVLDLEEKENINNILKRLDKLKFYYECYDTGSRGYHIHIFFNNEIEERDKEKFIIIFGADTSKKSKRNVIALEGCPHFKTGKTKTIFKSNEGINDYNRLTEFLENYVPDEYEEILKDPKLFQRQAKEIDKKVEGEKETREVILLCAAGRFVCNCQLASYNLLVNDKSGAGKDYVTSAVLEMIPKDQYIKRTRITPTVFTYWHNSKKEEDWTWDGKIFYGEDISDNVINSEVFKVMSSSGSSATVTIKQRAVDIEIKGKPVIITTSASTIPSAETIRRNIILNLDDSEDQTRAIMQRKSKEAITGIKLEYDPLLIESQLFLRRINIKIPYAGKIDKHFPEKNIVMRTNYPRFLDFIKASTALHQYQRKKDKQGYYEATGQDYDIARNCFLRIISNKYMLSLTKNQKQIFQFFEKNPNEEINANSLTIMSEVNLTLKSIIENLDKLVEFGLLDVSQGEDRHGRDITLYSLSKSYNPIEKIKLPLFKEL